MNLSSVPFLLIITMFFFLPAGKAQNVVDLPQLLPSYTENFSHLKSFPSLCFEDAFFDQQGKLWLKPCLSSQTGLKLFQFDGYEFNVVRGNLDKVPAKTNFVTLDADQRLVGYADRQVVFYDLKTNAVTTVDLPPTDPGTLFEIVPDGNGHLLVLSQTTDYCTQYELSGEQMVLLSRMEKENRGNSLFARFSLSGGNEAWYVDSTTNYLESINFTTDKKETFTLADFEIPPAQRGSFPNLYGKLYPVHGRYWYVLENLVDRKMLIQELGPTGESFQLVEDIPPDTEYAGVFGDASGNLIFLYRLADQKYGAILVDSGGRRFDYSAFFSAALLQGGDVTNLKSADFKQEVLICHTNGISFQSVQDAEAVKSILNQYSMRAMIEMPDRRVLITTQSLGPKFLYHPETGQLEKWENPDCTLSWASLVQDKYGFAWSVNRENFLKYDLAADTCQLFPASVQRNVFAAIDQDQFAYFRKGDPRHLALFDPALETSSPFTVNDQPLAVKGFVHDMLYSQKNDQLWIATTEGLVKVDLNNHTAEIMGLTEPFLDFRFLCIHEDERGRLWLGTSLGGVHIYDPDTGILKVLNNENGLANNTVVSILPDDDGDYWIGTYNGISIASPEGELIANLYEEDGLADKECNRYSYLKTSSGKLLIGSIKGLNVIEPQKIKARMRSSGLPKIYLNAISYFDLSENELTTQRFGLEQLGTLTLPAYRRDLQLKFALSNYFKPGFNKYAYQLEGVSDGWIPLGNQNSLYLNNLPAGRYRLLIRGSTGSGKWAAEPIAIDIHAREFFYKQVWFFLLCIILLGALSVLWILRLRLEIKKATSTIRADKEIIERQAEELKELDRAKARFFTNISHEFRTPLTIITGTAEQIRNQPGQWVEKGVDMIKHNALNMLNLVSQILDLRKLEAKAMKLNMVQGDIVEYLRYLAGSYESYARRKGLQVHFLPAIAELVMDFDPEKMMRIVFNLLSNAIKYTPDRGNIYLHINRLTAADSPWLELRVEDTGEGIPADQLPHIFDRFYQVDKSTGNLGKGQGTGIGLALTQELVKLMGGTIEVKSTLGRGTVFTVLLPLTNDSSIREIIPGPATEFSESYPDPAVVPVPVKPEKNNHRTLPNKQTAELPTLLIVEDNPDVLLFLTASLEDNYRLETAANGQEGINKAIEQVPDLIISDVMMPVKDGFELCDTLKNDERTSHIPIILLTAKADMESKISGLKTGADAYLTKPFEQKELMVRLEKLFELRQKLQAHYRSLAPGQVPENKEDEFVQKVRQAVLEHISDEDYSIAHLCRTIALSRGQLHNKLKALTGQSTSHFIRSVRLKKAKELLESSDLNVSEVGYEVGFKNHSHFSTAFLEEFGVPPSMTRK